MGQPSEPLPPASATFMKLDRVMHQGKLLRLGVPRYNSSDSKRWGQVSFSTYPGDETKEDSGPQANYLWHLAHPVVACCNWSVGFPCVNCIKGHLSKNSPDHGKARHGRQSYRELNFPYSTLRKITCRFL